MKFPSAWSQNSEVTASSKPLTARIDMGADVAGKGKCPECKQPMKTLEVAGCDMWVCPADQIVLPKPNDKTEN